MSYRKYLPTYGQICANISATACPLFPRHILFFKPKIVWAGF